MSIFKLPDLGEGLPDAEIVNWHVKVGDIIQHDQPLVTMETAKAIVEVPSPFHGKIIKLFGEASDVIKTQDPLVEYEAVGTEEKTNSQTLAEKEGREDSGTVAGRLEVGSTIIRESTALFSDRSPATSASSVKATPAVRALAKRLNVDLSSVAATGPDNTITSKDIENAAKVLQGAPSLEPLRGTRRAMSEIMTRSHQEIMPATIVDDAVLLAWGEKEDITVRLIEALGSAIQKEPALNAWFDAKLMGRRIFKELHLGLAVDTEEGLFVPVIKNANSLNREEIRQQIDTLKKQVAERTVAADLLRGASFILSNFGKFAGRYASPVVVPPMVGILGVGKIRMEVIARDNTPTISKVLPLSLSFDHRAVTGGEATRFLADVIRKLEEK